MTKPPPCTKDERDLILLHLGWTALNEDQANRLTGTMAFQFALVRYRAWQFREALPPWLRLALQVITRLYLARYIPRRNTRPKLGKDETRRTHGW